MKLAIVRFAIVMAVVLPAAPLAAEGQQAAKIPRVGLIVVSRIWEEAFLAGLQDAGYLVGKNILLERRYSNGRNEQFPAMVREVLALNVDVLVAASGPAIAAAKTATQTVPIVGIDLEVDPVASGYAASLARPGGNLTGVFLDMPEVSGKQLALLRETIPHATRIAILWDPSVGDLQFRAAQAAARAAQLSVESLAVTRAEDLGNALRQGKRRGAEAIVLLTPPLTAVDAKRIADLAMDARLPTMSGFTTFPEAGGLMAYGPSFPLMWRRAAVYVDMILRGEKPSHLPIERPTTIELVVNLKTAKVLRLTMSPSLLARAGRTISR